MSWFGIIQLKIKWFVDPWGDDGGMPCPQKSTKSLECDNPTLLGRPYPPYPTLCKQENILKPYHSRDTQFSKISMHLCMWAISSSQESYFISSETQSFWGSCGNVHLTSRVSFWDSPAACVCCISRFLRWDRRCSFFFFRTSHGRCHVNINNTEVYKPQHNGLGKQENIESWSREACSQPNPTPLKPPRCTIDRDSPAPFGLPSIILESTRTLISKKIEVNQKPTCFQYICVEKPTILL